MQKLTLLLLSSLLLLGGVACTNARTSNDAPDDVTEQAEEPQDVEDTQEDAESEIRQDQLNADIKAREERNNLIGDEQERAESDLESEVRAKLEANIPRGKLTIAAEESTVTVAGTVPEQKEYDTIKPLAKEIKGVEEVIVDVEVVPPTEEETEAE
ncbi:MAG: BON domain-containing protein [Okeania sp. SIO2D1]|nr:BON domain-containing protein [Okeania sp. SIO2D1]